MGSRGLAESRGRDRLVTPGAAGHGSGSGVCGSGISYQPAAGEDDNPAQRARNNAFHPRGDEVRKMAPKDRADFTDDQWRRLCADKQQQLRERLARQQAMPPGGPSPRQPSGPAGQHRRRRGEENHEGAPPIVKGRILGGKGPKGGTSKSPASRAAALFKKAVQRCTGAKPFKPSSSSSSSSTSSSSHDEKAKVKTYEVVRIGRALHKIPISQPVAARKTGARLSSSPPTPLPAPLSTTLPPPPPPPRTIDNRLPPSCQHRPAVESSHTVLVDAAISFPSTPSQSSKQHRRKRSIIKAVFLPSARDKTAAPDRAPNKRITTDMIQVLGCERLGASQVCPTMRSASGTVSSHRAGVSIPRLGHRVTDLRQLSEDVLISSNGGPYKPRLLYPLLIVMKSYIQNNTILYSFFVANSLYLLPMPRLDAFRHKAVIEQSFLDQAPKSPTNLLVWYSKDSRKMLSKDAPRSHMEDFGASSSVQRSKSHDGPHASSIKVSKRKKWFSFRASHAVRKILYKTPRKTNSATRAAEMTELHSQYLQETADIIPAVSFEEWKRLKSAMVDAAKKRQQTRKTELQGLTRYRGSIQGYRSSFVRLPMEDDESFKATKKLRRAVAKVFSGKSATKQTVPEESQEEIPEIEISQELEISQDAEVESLQEPEQAVQDTEPLVATNAEEWEDVDPVQDSINGPESMFPDDTIPNIEEAQADKTADHHGIEHLPPLYQKLYVKLYKADKVLKVRSKILFDGHRLENENSSTAGDLVLPSDPALDQLYSLYGIAEVTTKFAPMVEEWFCPTVEEIEYTIKGTTQRRNSLSAGRRATSHAANDKPLQSIGNIGKKVTLRKWGDLGGDIPESTPASVRDAMMDLEKELRKGETSSDPDPHSTVQSRSVTQDLEASKHSQQPNPAAVHAPLHSGYQPISHGRAIASTQSIMETKSTRKETPPKHASYEPPRRPYLRPFGTMPDGIPTVNTLQPRKNSHETGRFRMDSREPIAPIHSSPSQAFESTGEQGDFLTEAIERESGDPLKANITKCLLDDPAHDVLSMPTANLRAGIRPAAVPATTRSMHKDSPVHSSAKAAKQSHITSPFKPSSNYRSPTVASSGGYSNTSAQNATTAAGNPQRSISPIRRANPPFRPFGSSSRAPDEQMTFAKPRSQRDGPTTRFRPFNSSDHNKSMDGATEPPRSDPASGSGGTDGPGITTDHDEEHEGQKGQDGGPVEHVDLQNPRYSLKGKQDDIN
ncbi:hypothetical protein TWF696_003668 [Orbilia brochopaga]|uniref:Uncharacterized protein n=1 Tax=Orbilia brochopaga TaxID=3140254 RepID=A0AAV9V4P1_9PEZI